MPWEKLTPQSTVDADDWTVTGAATHHEALDDDWESPNDSDYVECGSSVPLGGVLELIVAAPSGPVGQGAGDVKLKLRHQANVSGVNLTVRLLQGGTIIRSVSYSSPTSWTNRSFDYSVANIAAITDWTDVRLRLEWTGTNEADVSVAGLYAYLIENAPHLPTMCNG